MKKLNNKGFAIAGILYSLLIMFLTILVFILSGLRTNKAMLERSTVTLNEIYKGDDSKSESLVNEAITNKMAPVDGKYIFSLKSGGKEVECISYLKKNNNINHNMTFLPNDCNLYSYSFTFEEKNSENIMELKKIYSFEGEDYE